MTIKILPARLANQIAAGEVVERPASVVKELVENSLDSGATRIDIDIEKGGSKLIRVRDNGQGIVKDELTLALSRHATSKIHTLDDLEAIISLGFRGEALASISSVSRLTLTSRPVTQDQAWSAYSEGRDMEVKLQPSAHPVGTTVEVLDLFFNTPARRKFLRTDKTEFTHIDELIKRIALSRFDVTINLKHNGSLVRQYRAANNALQGEKRILAVCGAAFVRHMLKIELEHNGLRLHGWITSPEGARQQSDLQYCYVNGRMMRDKLINHAIRQSYENSLKPEQFASYVLFIDLDPHQVDVNVHPAKHEVRFHQARLVHDFIYQALSDALSQSDLVEPTKPTVSAYTTQTKAAISSQISEAIERVPAYPGRLDYGKKEGQPTQDAPKHAVGWQPSLPKTEIKRELKVQPSTKEVQLYSELLSTPEGLSPSQSSVTNKDSIRQIGKAYSIVERRYLLAQSNSGEVLISLARAEWYRTYGQLQVKNNGLTMQPLLVPLLIKLTPTDVSTYQQHHALLERFAIQLKEKSSNQLMIMGVPQPLRQQNLQQLIPDLLSYLALANQAATPQAIATWLADKITSVKNDYTLSEGIQLLSELENLWEGVLPFGDTSFAQVVNFKATFAAFGSKI